MAKDVKVKIDLSKPVGSVGFGFPLLVWYEGATDSPYLAYTECYSLDDVVKAGVKESDALYKAAEMMLSQDNRPEKFAIIGGAISDEQAYGDITVLINDIKKVANKGWRQLVVVDGIETYHEEMVEYIDSTPDKMLFCSVATMPTLTEATKSNRAVILVNSTPYADAALVGATAGRPAGSFTYKFKTLKGVTPSVLSDAELKAIHEAGGIAYVTRAGDNITTEGKATSGQYIDITDSIDYVVQNIEYKIQKVLNTTAKVPYDDKGIALLEAATITALQEAGVNGIIAQNADGSYDYSVSFGARSATTEADRASRVYKYGTFRFSLAGAIHECEVTGEITY